MEKTKYLRVEKIHNFMDTIAEEHIIMSNITHYKKVTFKNRDIVLKKFEDYFEYEKQFRQSYKNKQNIEGYNIITQISEILILKENRKKLCEYVEKTIELITNIEKVSRLKYVVSYYRTRGGTFYLNIYCIDRLIYDKPLIQKTEKTTWINKNTGKKVHKSYKNAVEQVEVIEKEIHMSNKIRFKLVHQNNKKNFNSMIEVFKKILMEYELKIFGNQCFYTFKKKHLKKKIERNGITYYVNDHDNQYKDVFREYKQRAIKIYNTFVNAVYMTNPDLSNVDMNDLRAELNSLAKKHKNNILKYEQAMLDMIDLAINDELELYFSKN